MSRCFLALFLILTACTLPAPPAPPQRMTLSAPVTEGEVPFTATFSAVAEPQADAFSWTVGGEVQAETRDTFTTTFANSGLFVVRVAVAEASESVTVEARPPNLPDPDVTELKLTQTPGGPAPWGVAYTVAPVVNGMEARCTEGAGYERVFEGRFTCLQGPGDEVAVRFVDAAGEVTARAETSSEVTQNDGVAFAGRWRYRSRGVTETFEITEGSETLGRSEDGRFVLFTIRQKGAMVAEFTIDGRTVVLEPTPDEGGRQVFEADVYGLVLEAVTEPSEDGLEAERQR